jgi:hypothetical protein
MPAKIASFFHDSLVVGSAVALGTTYNTSDVHAHNLLSGAVPFKVNGPYQGRVTAVHVHLTSVVTATNIDLKICADANGDFALVPNTRCPLDAGITTTNSACAALKVDIPLFQVFGGGTFYVFAKLDAGTATWAQSCMTWTET